MVQESSYSVNRRRRNKRKLVEAHGSHCVDCGFKYAVYQMDFDHRDPSEKSFNLSYGGTKSYENLYQESLKCDLVCALCHRTRTHKQRCDGCELCDPAWAGEPYGGSEAPTAKLCGCGTKIQRKAKTCKACHQQPTVIEWPDHEVLQQMVADSSTNAVSKQLGVSFNAVKKRLQNHGSITQR